jgi:hypothetical protein
MLETEVLSPDISVKSYPSPLKTKKERKKRGILSLRQS